MDKILEKYSDDIVRNMDRKNMNKIVMFLVDNGCDYIEDVLSDYLDLFVMDYDEFVSKYNVINEKYKNNFLVVASEDMNLFEEFFDI